MGIIDLNMKGVGELPAEGQYRFFINKTETKPTKDKAGINLFVDCNIEAALQEDGTEWEGKRSPTLMLTWKNDQDFLKERFQEFLEAATKKPWREDSLQLDPDDLNACIFIADVTHGEYDGKPQLQWNNFYPAD